MKINDQIITNYDLEKESNYLLALNPKLNQISKNDLLELAKRSTIKEMIRKNEDFEYNDNVVGKMSDEKFETLFEVYQISKQFKYVDKHTKILFVRNRGLMPT